MYDVRLKFLPFRLRPGPSSVVALARLRRPVVLRAVLEANVLQYL